MADYKQELSEEQAIAKVVERARLALNLAASSGRPVTVILKHEDGRTTFAVTLDGER